MNQRWFEEQEASGDVLLLQSKLVDSYHQDWCYQSIWS